MVYRTLLAHRGHRSPTAWIAIAFLLAFADRDARGYAFITDDAGVPLRWQSATIPMKVIADNTARLSDGNTRAGAIVAAMTDASRGWNHYLGGIQFVPQIITTGQGFDHDLVNEVFFTPTAYTYTWDSNTLAITTAWYSGDKRLEADILFNTNQPNTWDSYRGNLKTGAVYDIQRVALHELGHVLGLDHPDQHGQSVSAVMNSVISNIDSLQPDDIAGGQVLYGAPGVIPVNDNFANATSLSFPGSTLVFSGAGITTIGATKEAGEPAHAGNAGGHSVWWKYTAAQTGYLTVDTTGSFFDTLVGIYTGSSVSNLSELASNDDSASTTTGASNVSVPIAAGNTCYIAIDGKDGDFGAITVTFSLLVPVPPSFSVNPSNQSLISSQTAYFTAYASGTPAPTIRWQRLPAGSGTWSDLTDTVTYAGTSTSTLTVNSVTVAMNGDQFRCVATNIASSTPSAPATLAVVAATPPSVSISGPASVNFGSYIEIFSSANGTTPLAFQWYKDGTALPRENSSDFYRSSAVLTDSGTYTLTVTNQAGTVTSNSVQVVVNPPVLPQITQQPVSVFGAIGGSTFFGVTATGIPTPTCQWYFNGQPIPYATQTSLNVVPVAAESAGTYYAVLTNPAGSVTSNSVTLTIVGPTPPSLPVQRISPVSFQAGSYLALDAATPSGTPPFSYQWFKDGAAIPGATLPFYDARNVPAADAGNYYLEISNAAGVTCSPDQPVTCAAPPAPWISNARVGDTVYFLFTGPGLIRRYDLAHDSWMPDVLLTTGLTPTAFMPTADGVFVAYGTSIVYRPPDLSSESTLAGTTNAVTDLFTYGPYVYYQDQSGVHTYRTSDRTAGPTFAAPGWAQYGGLSRPARPVFSATLGCGFTTYPAIGLLKNIIKITVAADGTFPSELDAPDLDSFPVGDRQYLSPDESLLIDSTGVAYHSGDLTYARDIGSPFDDLAFLDDGRAVVLRGAQLQVLDGSLYVETAHGNLPSAGEAIFMRAGSIYVFGAPATLSDAPTVAKVDPATLAPVAVPSPSPQGLVFSFDGVFVDPAGIINVVSRTGNALFRFDPASGGFAPSINLRGRPFAQSYDWGIGRVVLDYSDGTFTEVRFTGDGAEHAFSAVNPLNWPDAIVTMDDLLEVNAVGGNSGDIRLVLDAQGNMKSLATTYPHFYRGVDWEPVTARLYSLDPNLNGSTLGYESVPATGVLPGPTSSTVSTQSPVLCFRPDGSAFFTLEGAIFDENFLPLGSLGAAVLDGTWQDDRVVTIDRDVTGTGVHWWAGPGFAQSSHASVPGYPIAVRTLPDDTVAVVTSVQGFLGCYVFDANASLMSAFVNSTTATYGPTIATEPKSAVKGSGASVSFSILALASTSSSFQWQVRNSSGLWSSLSDDNQYSGTQSSTLTIAHSEPSMTGDQFRCVVTSASATATSDAATLTSYLAVSDLNGDGKSDLVWTNTTTGDRSVWFMNGTAIDSFGYLAGIDPAWHIVGTGDFNGDGKTDLVWENLTTGDRTFWQMNGTAIDSFGYLAFVDGAWHIAAIGDFNADGQPDVVWENTTTGDRAVWFLNGQAIASFGYIAGIDPAWHIVGAADFDGDGQTDLVWENLVTGDRTIWYMNGATLSSFGYIANIPGDWHIATVTDLDGDGHPDLVWEDTATGDRAVWLMNNATLLSSPYLAFIDPVWRIDP